MNARLGLEPAELRRFCEQYGIRRLSLFGSRLRGSHRPDSDVDLLVEFAPGRVSTLIGLAQMEIDLSQRLGGRLVDLRTASELSQHFRDQVLREAELQYAAG